MANPICPNTNLQDWKTLVSGLVDEYGEDGAKDRAYLAFFRHNADEPTSVNIPSVDEAKTWLTPKKDAVLHSEEATPPAEPAHWSHILDPSTSVADKTQVPHTPEEIAEAVISHFEGEPDAAEGKGTTGKSVVGEQAQAESGQAGKGGSRDKSDADSPRETPSGKTPQSTADKGDQPKAATDSGGSGDKEGQPDVKAIFNADVEKRRTERGELPFKASWKKSNPELHDSVMKIIEKDPDAPKKTFEKFQADPKRVPTDEENVLLNAHQVSLTKEYNDAGTRAAEARKNNDLAGESDAQLDLLTARHQLDAFEKVLHDAGTAWGRSGQSRGNMFMDDAFTYKQMVKQLTTINRGKELPASDLKELQEIADKHKAATDKLERELSGKQAEIDRLQKHADDLGNVMYPSHVLKVAERYVEKLHTMAEKERAKLREKGVVMSAGIDPRDLKSYAIIGADHLATMTLDFAKWSKKMVDEFGENIKPHLQEIFDGSKKIFDEGHSALRTEADKTSQLLKTQKTRMSNRIAELEKAIENRERIVRTRKSVEPDAELEDLKARVASLQEDYNAIFPKEPRFASDAQRMSALEKRLEKKQKAVSDAMTSDDFTVKKPERREPLDPQTVRKSATATPEERASAQRVLDAQAEIGKQEKTLARKRRDYETKNMGWIQWTGKKAEAYVRIAFLSNPVTFAKLAASATSRIVTGSIKAGVGVGWSKVFSEIAAKAETQGSKGFVNDVRIESNSFAKVFTKGLADTGNIMLGRMSEITRAYGKMEKYPQSISDWIGTYHEAFKAPAFRNEFERSLGNRIAYQKLTSPDVPMDSTDLLIHSQAAYLDAQRMIFKEDNFVVRKYQGAIQSLAKSDKTSRQVLASVMNTIFPIVRIPTNIVKQSFEASPAGLVKGLVGARAAYKNGIENLTTAQADVVMRNLKAGSVGSAMWALGLYLGPSIVGGFYQRGDKNEYDKPTANTIQFSSYRIPSWIFHDPIANSMMMGATMRKVYDASKDKYGPALAATLAAGSGTYGLAAETPFVSETADLTEISKIVSEPDKASAGFYAADEAIKSRVVPQLSDFTAKLLDQNPEGHWVLAGREPNKRSPKDLGQHIETAIPGLRQDVPLSPDKESIAQKVRSGKTSEDDAREKLQEQLSAGDITRKQFKSQLKGITLDAETAAAKQSHAVTDQDFIKDEKEMRDVKPEHKAEVEAAFRKKMVNMLKDKSAKATENADRLRKLIDKYFPADK